MKYDGIIRVILLFASLCTARRVKPYKCPEMPWESSYLRNASTVQVLADGEDSTHHNVSKHDRFGYDLFRIAFGLIEATTKGAAVHVTESLRKKYAAVLPCLRSTQGFDSLDSLARQHTEARAPLLRQTGAFSAIANDANRPLLQQAFQTPCAFEEGSHAGYEDITIYFGTYEAQRTGNFSVGLDERDSETIPERHLLDPHSHLLARVPVAFYDAILKARLAQNTSALPRPRVFVVCDPAYVQHSTVQYLVEKYGALVHSSMSGMARAPGHLEAWHGFQRDFCFLLSARTVVLSPSWFGWMGTFLSSTTKAQVVSRFQGLPVGGGGFASKGELKTLAFLDTPRVSFVTALQVNEKNHRGCMQIRESAPARTSTVSGKKLFEAVTSTCTVSCTSYSYSDNLACMLLRCGLASDELSKCSLVISAFPSVLLLPSPFYSVQAVGGSYLMVGDLDLSVQLVHWRAKDKSLNLIGNDSSQATGVAAVGAVVRRMGGVE